MEIQEASEDITRGGIMFLSLKTSYMEGNTQKDDETNDYMHEITLMRLGHAGMRPEHAPCSLGMMPSARGTVFALMCLSMRLGHVVSGSELFFSTF
jgi:hypothetical protein